MMLTLFGIGATAQAQLASEIGQQPSTANIGIDAGTDGPDLGWISFLDDRAALRGGTEGVLGNSLSASKALRLGEELPPEAVDLDDIRLEAGKFMGLQGTLSSTGLAWGFGVVYHTPPEAAAAAAGLEQDSMDLHGALRFDSGPMVVTASLHYAPRSLATGKSTHYPMLAAEVPITSSFTLLAGIRRPWTSRQSGFNEPDYTQWSISGTVNMLGFDVMLSYSESDAAGAAETPRTEALFKVKRQF